MKKIFLPLTTALLLVFFQGQAQTAILPSFNGQNYWVPNKGTFTGQLQANWDNIVQSGVQYMRVGGKGYDGNAMWSYTDINSIIDELQAKGIVPIVQVPITYTLSAAANATVCAGYVDNINNANSQGITYWAIGNEPDGSYSPYFESAQEIQTLIQAVSPAMKTASAGIKIIGPSLSAFNPTADPTMLTTLTTGTCSITGTISVSPNIYYIDYIAFNIYPFRDESYWKTGSAITIGGPIQRSEVMDYLRSPNRLKEDLYYLNNTLISGAGRTGTLGIMITEANISYEQNTAEKGIGYLGPGSFLGGQLWAEMMAVAMEEGVSSLNFWSVIEGTSGNNRLTDIGYIQSEPGGDPHRSTYWHYQLMAAYYKSKSGGYTSKFYPGTVRSGGNVITDVKAFAANLDTKSQVVVTIMNQKDAASPSSHTYEVRTNNATASTTSDLNITLSTGVSYTTTGTIGPEETQWLVFDCAGNYAGKWVYDIDKNVNGYPPEWIGTPSVTASFSLTTTFTAIGTNGQLTDATLTGSTVSTVWSSNAGIQYLSTDGNHVNLVTPTNSTYTYNCISTQGSSGCTFTQGVEITGSFIVPVTGFYVYMGSVTNATCGRSNGAATVAASGCSVTPTYLWDNGSTTATATGLSPGFHSVNVSCGGGGNIPRYAVIGNDITPASTISLSSATLTTYNYIASQTITAGPAVTVGAGTTVHFYGGENVHLGDDFHVTGTTNFKATVLKTNCMEPQ